jgi:thiopeptide-type bacteriocin biosynthesis protein
LIAVEPTEYLTTVLERAENGQTREELATVLVGDDITLDDGRAYIDELIDAQLLVPDLGVQVTGAEPVESFAKQLGAAGLVHQRATVDDVRERLAQLDARGLGNSPQQYESIAGVLGALPGTIEMSRLFQVDMVKPASATLATRVAADVARVIEQLAKITPAYDAFAELKRAFRERWEDRVVPLAEVLDEESGIGFEMTAAPGDEGTPLLAGLRFPAIPNEPRVAWGPSHEHLLRRLAGALLERAHELVLDDADLTAMAAPTPVALPDAFAALIRMVGASSILFENASGPSGGRLLGRFCHASPDIDALVRAHLALEQASRPDAVLAEVVHLNEGRVGNILCRPVLRSHEIVYLGISGAAPDAQIRIDDLMVSVRDDRVVLTSRTLGKEVLPRLTTAHNYRRRNLGVYRFLCALAEQGRGSVGWSWGVLETAPFLPRVRLRDVIVSRAIWNLDENDLQPLTAAVRVASQQPDKRAAVLDVVAALRRRRALPRLLAISDGDNELPIDLDNPLLAAAFADELSGAKRARLIELLPSPDELLVHGPEGTYANEIVLTFTRSSPTVSRTVAAKQPPPAATIQRDLLPGSEWLYAKIYCGQATADRVLREAVAPLVREAIANGDAHHWFFIRYRDPDPHLRVRLSGDPARLLTNVLPALQRALAPLVELGAVRKLVLDTYVREIERYGGPHGIELVEQVFWHDSDAVLGIVELLEGDAGADARWRLALRGMDSMLDALGLSLDERAHVARSGKEAIGREMRADRGLWASIGTRFTKERADLEQLFERNAERDADHDLEPGFQLLARRDLALAAIGDQLRHLDTRGELSPRLTDLAWSLVHMHANRLLHASQRTQELVLHDFLRRLHDARRARGFCT